MPCLPPGGGVAPAVVHHGPHSVHVRVDHRQRRDDVLRDHARRVEGLTVDCCACGRRKLPDPNPTSLCRSPVQAEIMSRLEAIREERIAVASANPPDFHALDRLGDEAIELRARLAALAYRL